MYNVDNNVPRTQASYDNYMFRYEKIILIPSFFDMTKIV